MNKEEHITGVTLNMFCSLLQLYKYVGGGKCRQGDFQMSVSDYLVIAF